MDSKKPNRRRFLKGGAAMAGLAAGAVKSAPLRSPLGNVIDPTEPHTSGVLVLLPRAE
jgi:hypothetical protein